MIISYLGESPLHNRMVLFLSPLGLFSLYLFCFVNWTFFRFWFFHEQRFFHKQRASTFIFEAQKMIAFSWYHDFRKIGLLQLVLPLLWFLRWYLKRIPGLWNFYCVSSTTNTAMQWFFPTFGLKIARRKNQVWRPGKHQDNHTCLDCHALIVMLGAVKLGVSRRRKIRYVALLRKELLTFYTLTSGYIFSITFSIHFLWYWQREFVKRLRASLVADHFLYSHDLNVCFRDDTDMRK